MYEVNRKNIWSFRQNNPELVIQDAAEHLGLDETQQEILRTILLARGINKWLKVRRDLIAYKTLIKVEIKQVMESIRKLKNELKGDKTSFDKHRLLSNNRETLKVLERVRGDLRAMCHSDRLVYWPHSTSRDTLKEMNTIKVGIEIN